jgi:hypothetical protein
MLWKGTGHSCMQKTGRLAFIFLFLFLVATLATGFHHHDDDSDHHDCPICAAGHHFFPACIHSFSLAIHQTISNYAIPQEPLLYDCIGRTLLACRAPPA